tara:strand:- start:253 stop:435 length:183 start_codon:yes stop_codon:yes gene_type:complete
MVPIDWEDFTLNFDLLDSLQPIETIGFLPEADFNLKYPKLLISSLEKEKKNKRNLYPGII